MANLEQGHEKQLAQQIETSKKIETQIKMAVEIVGNAHRYQVLLILYLILCFILATYLLAGSSYFFMNPKFNCNGQILNQEEACLQLDSCTLQNSYTIASKVGLFCEGKTERSVIQSMLGIGACLGVLFVNFISDYKGRRFSFIFSLIAGVVSIAVLIVGAYTQIWQLFIISQILAGFYGNSIMTLIYVMSGRLMSKKYSSFTILITNAFFGLTEISLILFTGYFSWEDLSIAVMFFPSIGLLVIAFFIIIEDPAYLFTKKQYQQCIQSLKKIANINKTQRQFHKCSQLIDQLKNNHVVLNNSSAQGTSKRLQYFRLLSKKEVFVPILLIGLNSAGGYLSYYMLTYAISTVGTSYEWNIGIFGVVQSIGILPMMFLGEKTPRKMGMLSVAFMHIIVSMFFIFNLPMTVQTALIAFIRFIFASANMLYIFLVVQTFPQHIQATYFGIVQFVGQTGKFFAPFCVDLSDGVAISPILMTGIVSLLVGIPTLLPLKETLVRKNKEELKQSLLQ